VSYRVATKLQVKIRDRWYAVEVEDLHSNPLRVLVDGEPVEVDLDQLVDGDATNNSAEVSVEGPAPAAGPTNSSPSAVKVFASPMPGVVLSVAVSVGDQVVTGDEICVLEAMKMQQTLRADWSGVVRTVHVQPGQQVLDGAPIVELE